MAPMGKYNLKTWRVISALLMVALVLALNIIADRSAHGQSACGQLGVDCSHPTVQQAPSCDDRCRAETQRYMAEYYRQKEAYEAEQREINQQKRDAKARKEAYKKELAEANKTGNYALWEDLINDSLTPDNAVQGMRWEEWKIMESKGYNCPQPPIFDGISGCHGNPKYNLDSTYVPLPLIEGKSWTATAIAYSDHGTVTVTTKDGHVWHGGVDDLTRVNLMDARIQTGKQTEVRFILPDGHSFNLGHDSDMTFDSFVYDPDSNSTSIEATLARGTFRFVTGLLAHQDPYKMQVRLAVGNIGLRGTDVEVEHAPVHYYSDLTGLTAADDDEDRWEICAYDGVVTINTDWLAAADPNIAAGWADGDHAIPVGSCFESKHPEDSKITTFSISKNELGKAWLSSEDNWDKQFLAPQPATGRQ